MFMKTVGSALKITSPAPSTKYSFQKLRDHLPPEKKDIADELDAVRQEIETQGATAAAERLRRLDEYAIALPPESLAGLLDSNAALDELEDALSVRYRYPWLVAVRNLLALLPLLFTWWSLSQATSAYQVEVHLHPSLVYRPFLMLWENGFGQGMWPTFSFVASADAVLFILIIGVTGAIHWFERKAQTRARQIVAHMDQSVMHLVAALGQSRVAFSNNPSDWAVAVQQVIAAAMKETRQLAQSGQEVVQAAASATKAAVNAVKAAHTGVDQIAEQTREYIRQVKGEFAETVKQLHDEDQAFLAGLQRETNERLSSAFEETSRQMREQFGTTSQQMSDEINLVIQASREAIAQMREESHDAMVQINAENRQFLADANNGSLATLTNAAKTIDQIADRLRVSVESLQSAIEQHKDGADALVNSMAKIGDVTQRFGDNMQTFTTTTASLDAHVNEVAQAQERFTQRVETMATALTSAAGETKTATVGMQATSVSLTSALDQATTMSGEVTQASRQWGQAQTGLADAVQALRVAAAKLSDVKVNVTHELRWWPFGRRKAA